jgi:hypothetical protein
MEEKGSWRVVTLIKMGLGLLKGVSRFSKLSLG